MSQLDQYIYSCTFHLLWVLGESERNKKNKLSPMNNVHNVNLPKCHNINSHPFFLLYFDLLLKITLTIWR